jgi:hypothetical protein
MLYGYCFNESDPEYHMIRINDGSLTDDILEEKYQRFDSLKTFEFENDDVYVGIIVRDDSTLSDISESLRDAVDKLENEYDIRIRKEPRLYRICLEDDIYSYTSLYIPKIEEQ